ncbi:hypothetical protein ATCC90586_008543 [Pythium insidiosum]|nr:hypothetical protein ATCC90586_008543 [Pythium insidiosum]
MRVHALDAAMSLGGERTAERETADALLRSVSSSSTTEKRRARLSATDDGATVARAPRLARFTSLPLRQRALMNRTAEGAQPRRESTADDAQWLEDAESAASWDLDGQCAGEDTMTRLDDASSHRGSSIVLCSTERSASVAANAAQHDAVARIATLKALCDAGFISVEEFERRKAVIIDELTFASHGESSPTLTPTKRRSMTPINGVPMIVPHAPNFRDVVPEVAIKHVFHYDSRQWSSTQVYVALDETPFSKGSLRVVYHLQDLNEMRDNDSYVAKVAIDPDEDPQTYFRDIELQAHCAYYAELYNSYQPPKRVEFLKAWVLELTERDGVLCAVEEYIPGEYRKHNNNFGSVSDDERNTPQAFSHFTFEASNHELLAVDIQGVGDKYTDPQIHTVNGHDFGKGNLGHLGFQKFLSTHRCNSICRYLKLPAVNPKQERHADQGTLPLQELMSTERVRAMRFDSRHYYESAPMLQKYIAQCREMEERERERAETTTRLGACSLTCGGCSIQ